MNRLGYNPDVLSCLANLSNDEVFTPPQLANQMLDMLPEELFRSPDTRFLDPCCKSGVFLREIARRLIAGLADQIPDLQERIDHILHHQLYGIAITRLTSLMSRRSLYCSKDADGKYSISHFDDSDGNIRYRDLRHTWQNGKCTYCGASKEVYDRAADLESHAYEFIHTDNPKKLFKNMTFDVIIGNPPYQLTTAGEDNGAQAKPLYNLFVQQAKKLRPTYLVMIIPARWYAGGWGLDEFRDEMLTDRSIKVLHDFIDSSECFSGVQIEGGICYFIRDSRYDGMAKIISHIQGVAYESKRFLKEPNCDIFIRDSRALFILRKVRSFNESTFDSIVSTKKPFGMTTNYHGKTAPFRGSIKLFANKRIEYVSKEEITRNIDAVDKTKIFISKAYGSGNSYPKQVINNPIYGGKNTCCTETYLLVGPFNNEKETRSAMDYMRTKFFRFLVLLVKNTQDSMKKVYQFVPLQDFTRPWTDEELYAKYGLTDEEIQFIESMIRPME